MKTNEILQSARERFEKKFDQTFPDDSILYEFPVMVNKVRGSVIRLGDETTFYEGRYIPKEHIKSQINSMFKKELRIALESYKSSLKERIEKIKTAVQESTGSFKYDSCYDDVLSLLEEPISHAMIDETVTSSDK